MPHHEPAGHVVQAGEPLEGAYDPAAQGVQVAAPAAEYLPGRHGMAAKVPSGHAVPGAQDRHCEVLCAPMVVDSEALETTPESHAWVPEPGTVE